jgi:hypothetical protein
MILISYLFPVIRNTTALPVVSGGVAACIFYEIRNTRFKKAAEINLAFGNLALSSRAARSQQKNISKSWCFLL